MNRFGFAITGGPRICFGQQVESPNVSGRCDRYLSRGRNAIEKMWPRMHLTIHAKGDLWVVMGEAPSTTRNGEVEEEVV